MKFTPEPIPRPAGRPASSTPLRDVLNSTSQGVDAGYAVVPRSLAESMPLPWQQQFATLLAEFHQAFAHLQWPVYRVVPSRYERLVDLDEEQLAEAGYLMEIDSDGEIVYRGRNGAPVDNPEQTTALVSVLDPIPNSRHARVEPAASAQPPTGYPDQPRPDQSRPTPPGGFPNQPGPPATPPGGFPAQPGAATPQGHHRYPSPPEKPSW
ncbi:hypothetical protein [Kutzneria sp. CA-103260]|uniref:hypothetical protein n=1 Tax=Kutzneria sp. CA-103260 TaxID=2802641 RepID=UPI001BEEE7BE|nr:hypothetical protein [Kutzneria sp. CA-103260]QUQ68954.1 hypothetical protein JJ691_67080 [Kutzneria sp. CA-103260]